MEWVLFIDAVLYGSGVITLVTLGALVTIRFTGYPDLTIDGSFAAGAATYAACLLAGIPGLPSLLAAILAGSALGCITACCNQLLGIGKLIAGVMVATTITLSLPYLIGSNTLGLLNSTGIFTPLTELDQLISGLLFTGDTITLHVVASLTTYIGIAGLIVGLGYFSRSQTGCALRYLGATKEPLLLPTKKQTLLTVLGLVLGNSFVALAGALQADRVGGFSHGMGLGVLLIGFAALMLGESIAKKVYRKDTLSVWEQLLWTVVGSILYVFLIQCILVFGPNTLDVRLVSAGLILLLLALVARHKTITNELF